MSPRQQRPPRPVPAGTPVPPSFPVALDFVKRVQARFGGDSPAFKEFGDILITCVAERKPVDDFIEEMDDLLRDHDDLFFELTDFYSLPPQRPSSLDYALSGPPVSSVDQAGSSDMSTATTARKEEGGEASSHSQAADPGTNPDRRRAD